MPACSRVTGKPAWWARSMSTERRLPSACCGGLDQRLSDRTGIRPAGRAALTEKVDQSTSHPGQVGQLRFDLRQARGVHGLHRPAVAPVGQVEQRGGLLRLKTRSLGFLDASDPPHQIDRVVAHDFDAHVGRLAQASNRQPVPGRHRPVNLRHRTQRVSIVCALSIVRLTSINDGGQRSPSM